MTRDSKTPARAVQGGFGIVTAIFLVVILAAIGVFIISVSTLQQSAQTLDTQGNRAYQAARAGVEWGAHRVLDPNNTLNAGSCLPLNWPATCGGSTDIASLAGTLSTFTVTVTCAETPTTEGNREIRVYQLVATACNQPSAGSCPNLGTPAAGYVERRITATLSKCKDPTAAPPRCSCG